MAFSYTWLAPDFATSAQMTPDDVAQAAAAGFRSIVNNRPDFEGGASQPTSQAIAQAASAAGVDYAFLPVQSAFQTPAEIARMGELLGTLPKPVLAFCRSGTRSGNLYRAAKAR
jgi:uncharacterized protein (TIGR01244 family)